MKWLTIKTNNSDWHIDMDKVSMMKVDLLEEDKVEKVSFWFQGDGDDASLVFESEEDNVEAVAKTVNEFLSKVKK